MVTKTKCYTALAVSAFAALTVGAVTGDRPTAPAAPPLTLSSTISNSTLNTGQRFTAWLVIRNDSAGSLRGLHWISTETEGASLLRLDWTYQDKQKSCDAKFLVVQTDSSPGRITRTDARQCELLATELSSGQSVTVRAEFEADGETSGSIVHATIGYSDSSEKVSSTADASLGRISVEPSSYSFLRRVYGVLKDLALPIVLALLAAWFSYRDKKREAKRKENEDERSRKDAKAAEKRALTAETWKDRLDLAHSYATKYYLPISSAALTMDYYRKKRAKEKDSSLATEYLQREFFGLMLFKQRTMKMQKEIAAYFFKNRMGERLVGLAFNEFQDLYVNDNGDHVLRPLVKMAGYLSDSESSDQFLARISATEGNADVVAQAGEFRAGLQYFGEWAELPDVYSKAYRYLNAFRSILNYEINRPFEYWYDGLDPMKCDKDIYSLFEDLLIKQNQAGEGDQAERKQKESLDKAALKTYLDSARDTTTKS